MSRNSVLCPNCNRLISRDEPQCPFCNLKNPGAWWKNNALIRRISGEDGIIQAIIYLSVCLYILSLVLYMPQFGFSSPFNALSPDGRSLMLLGATGTRLIGKWLFDGWTLISAIYLHGSLLHIIFNMLALRQIGTLTIQLYGPYRMISLYTLTGVAGFASSFLGGVGFTIGASGAICGLIGACLYYGKSRGGTYGQAVYKHTSGWIIGLFLIGLMPQINNWGHGGGLLAGIVLGWLFSYKEKRRELFKDKALAGFCVLITILILAWAVFRAIVYRILL